jgi:hypothetical protein
VEGGTPRPKPRPLWFAAAGVIVAFLLVAHGCHTGDHDDEPAFIPFSTRDRDRDQIPE